MTDSNPTGDRVHIEQLKLDVRIGVPDEERSNTQRLVLNITVWPKRRFDALEDDIDKTINYVELCRSARQLVETRQWKLIETVAAELAAHLLTTFGLSAAEVEVRKFVLPNTEYVSATVRRNAAG